MDKENARCLREQLRMDFKGEGINYWIRDAIMYAAIATVATPYIVRAICEATDEVYK